MDNRFKVTKCQPFPGERQLRAQLFDCPSSFWQRHKSTPINYVWKYDEGKESDCTFMCLLHAVKDKPVFGEAISLGRKGMFDQQMGKLSWPTRIKST